MSKFNHLFHAVQKGDSFSEYVCGENTARIDFVSESCVRVAIYKEKEEMLPTFSVCPDNAPFSFSGRNRLSTDGFSLCKPEREETESVHSFILPCGTKLKVELQNFILSFYQNGEKLFSDRTPLAYNLENEFGSGSFHYLSRADGERIFGLGDKGGDIDKAGRSFRIETSDCMGYDAKSSDPLYKHIPFYICENSVGCYGVFYDTTDTSYFDFGKEINNYYEHYKYFKTEDNCLVYYIFFGSKLSILQQFARLCGRQAFPPKWSFDYCASTMAYTDAERSQEKMSEFIRTLKKYDFSCGGFYLSSGYTSIGDRRYVFNWNHDKFPDVDGFVKEFSDNGIELIPNIKPAFLVDHPLYKEIAESDLFIKNPDGTPFVTEFWDGLGSYLDFTNKSAFDFWSKKVKNSLLNYGITATWNDNNEFDIKDTDAIANGFDSEIKAHRIRPTLTYLMVASSYKAQTELRPEIRPFLSTRSGGIGLRRYAQTWSGDNRSEFEDLRYCHNIGLTMSMSGLYFYGHDLGGFSGDMPSCELLLRWLQHGIFEPRLTVHSWNSDGSATMPWSYPEVIGSVRSLFAQRKRLMPYIYDCAYKSVVFDEPMNAPSFLYFNDKNLYKSTDCLMLGRNILVFFAFDEGENQVKAYLPKGADWHLNGKLYHGGKTVNLEIKPTDKMPYFVRSGCILPEDIGRYGFDCDEKVVFTVYPTESDEFESEFFSDDGRGYGYLDNDCVRLKFTVKCDESTVTVKYENLGKQQLKPTIRLCEGDKRLLEVE